MGCIADKIRRIIEWNNKFDSGTEVILSIKEIKEIIDDENHLLYDDEIEYISGSGIPPYVVSGTDDPDAGIAGRDAEDFRFYDGPGELRIQEMALPLQWNEINYQQGYGGGSSMKVLMAMFL